MQKLRAAWRLLRDAGVRRFVFTADHGFLLIDESAATAQPHGRQDRPEAAACLLAGRRGPPGRGAGRRSPTSATRASAGHLMFPETTAVFDTGRRPMGFVHGGNSLQERVIPVLTLVHRDGGRAAATLSTSSRPRPREGVAGHALRRGDGRCAAQQGARLRRRPRDRARAAGARAPGRPGRAVPDARQGADRRRRRSSRPSASRSSSSSASRAGRRAGPGRAPPPGGRGRRRAVRRGRAFRGDGRRGTRSVPPRAGDRRDGRTARLAASTPRGRASGSSSSTSRRTARSPRARRRRCSAARASSGGSPTGSRNYAAKAPFDVRIDVVGGVKRYVREGTAT